MKIRELVEGVEYNRGDGGRYKVENGYFLSFCTIEGWQELNASYYEFSNMRFTECEFKPNIDDFYYFPDFIEDDGYDSRQWGDDSFDNNVKNRVGIYRTKEQAIEKAREWGWVE